MKAKVGVKKKILVVDDNHHIAEQVASFLEESGFVTQCVTSVREVFPAVWAFSPEMVIFDVDLGIESGFSLAESLLDKGLVSSFVFMTGGDVSRRPPSLASFAVLEKPFSIYVLLEIVRSEFARAKASSADRDGD